MQETAEKVKDGQGIGKAAHDALVAAVNFICADGGSLRSQAKPVIKIINEALGDLENGIIRVEQPEKNVVDFQLNSDNPENPRMIVNIPADRAVHAILPPKDGQPAYAVVLVRADQWEKALGCLGAAAYDVSILHDIENFKRMQLVAGVADAAAKGIPRA